MKKENYIVNTILAKNLKRMRTELGLTYSGLAQKTNIRESYLKKIENDDAPKMNLIKLVHLSRGLNVKIKELLS